MSRTILVTGSASGIGAAVRSRLIAEGHRVIGADLRDADIEVDLGSAAGRARLIEAATRMAPEGLDGVLAGAGISGTKDAVDIMSVNYFGAVATLDGLRPLLARSPRGRAVAISSASAILDVHQPTIDACLGGNEAAAREAITESPQLAYFTSKKALALWVRHAAIRPEWGGANILINAVAPGVIETPMTRPLLADPEMVRIMSEYSNPMAVPGYAKPEEVAELIDFLLNMEGHYILGQTIFIDGGNDAIKRPDMI